MVALGGWGCPPFIWEPLQPFVEDALTLYAFGYPGIDGSQPLDDFSEYTPQALAHRFLTAMQLLQLHRPVLMAHSMGTEVALSMVLEAPSELSALILLGPNAGGGAPGLPFSLNEKRDEVLSFYRRHPRQINKALRRLVLQPMVTQPDPVIAKRLRDAIDTMDRTALLGELFGAANADLSAAIPLLPPTLCLIGDQDQLSTPEIFAAHCIPVQTLPDCGHMATLEQPQKVAQAILPFLEQQELLFSSSHSQHAEKRRP
ncbi:MAG: alpha/beta hydrolase [Firmicutes bacterium]|nr:alpha/beta hydrolase [Bacillota bacterium]